MVTSRWAGDYDVTPSHRHVRSLPVGASTHSSDTCWGPRGPATALGAATQWGPDRVLTFLELTRGREGRRQQPAANDV